MTFVLFLVWALMGIAARYGFWAAWLTVGGLFLTFAAVLVLMRWQDYRAEKKRWRF